MQVVGIIAEYNPFHNGHLYQLELVKKKFPNSLIVLVINGYFLERGEISRLTKKDKTTLALEYGANLVLELPVLYGTQSADVFAESAITILNHFGVTHLVFGSESNQPELLIDLAKRQLTEEFLVQKDQYLKQGFNYPTALSKSIHSSVRSPNDLLGIAYAKTILMHQFPIKIVTILRTNDYHNQNDVGSIVSASTIRQKLECHESIDACVPAQVPSLIQMVDERKLWMLLQLRILTDNHLKEYLTVDEGIEHRLRKVAQQAHSYSEFVHLIKTKRYTYNKIKRMTIHILLGITKQDNDESKLSYVRVLGFDCKGQTYLRQQKKQISISLKPDYASKVYEFEKRAIYLYEVLTNSKVSFFEFANCPIVKKDSSLFDK